MKIVTKNLRTSIDCILSKQKTKEKQPMIINAAANNKYSMDFSLTN